SELERRRLRRWAVPTPSTFLPVTGSPRTVTLRQVGPNVPLRARTGTWTTIPAPALPTISRPAPTAPKTCTPRERPPPVRRTRPSPPQLSRPRQPPKPPRTGWRIRLQAPPRATSSDARHPPPSPLHPAAPPPPERGR